MLKLTFLTLFLVTNLSPPAPTITDLSWISGDWQTAPGGRALIENIVTDTVSASSNVAFHNDA